MNQAKRIKPERKDKFADRVQQLYERLVNKMLETHKVNFNFVKNHTTETGEPWYQYYTMTKEQSTVYKEWAINEIRHSLRLTKSHANHEFNNFWGNYGLKVVEPKELQINYYPEGEE